MRKKKQSKFPAKYVLLIMTILCAVIIGCSLKASGSGPVSAAAGAVLAPMQKGVNQLGSGLTNLREHLRTKKSLEKEYGDIELSYEVGKIKDCSKTKLKDIQKELNEFDIEIEEAKIASIEATLKHNEGKEHNDMQLVLVKIGRSWYVANWGDL